MTIATKVLNITGLLFLTHAVYSSYEHHLVLTTTASKPKNSSSAQTSESLPTDIVIEALFSLVLLVLGIVLGSPTLRPIQWSAWAGEAERDTRRAESRKKVGGREGEGLVGLVHGLEDRVAFYDVRAKRKEFADWMRTGGTA